ncbi:MAG TPA: oligopeptide/dipeptide ABC transporter ATP-binding protein [Iamia sp.]|nr:oligopeptide/dipeptide ABC transporter ATP-binding protein [Iamia sp.]
MSGTGPTAIDGAAPLLEVEGLTMEFRAAQVGARHRDRSVVRAVDNVDLVVRAGETVALVGESGCGKSTLARCILRMYEPVAGTVRLRGTDVLTAGSRELRALRRHVQLVFQDPHGAMNPRMRVGDVIAEPLRAHGTTKAEAATRVAELLELVGLGAGAADRMPHEFSGGQRQRIAIARALALEPDLVICDESVSALDVSVQAQIINLLQDLQDETGVSFLFISHDMSVVHHMAHRVAVMYLGRVVEEGPCEELFADPQHPYTRQLLASVPVADPVVERGRRGQSAAVGDVPSPSDRPSGCVFRTRCPHAIDACAETIPTLVEVGPAHRAACIRVPLPAEEGVVVVAGDRAGATAPAPPAEVAVRSTSSDRSDRSDHDEGVPHAR